MSFEVEERIERITEALLLLEPTDFQELAGIHTEFEQLIAWSEKMSRDDVLSLASNSLALVEKVILQDTDDPSGALNQVAQNLSQIQNLVRELPGDVQPIPQEQSLEQKTSEASGKNDSVSHPTALPAHVDEQIFADFLNRQSTVLERFEELILSLEQGRGESVLAELRRIVHTLKGEAGLLSLDEVQILCHATEDFVDSGYIIDDADKLFGVKDWLSRAFDAYSGKGSMPEPADELLKSLTGSRAKPSSGATVVESRDGEQIEALVLDTRGSEPPSEEQEQEAPLEADPDLLKDFVAESREHLDACDVHLLTLESNPEDEEALNAVFRAFHTIKGVAGFLMLNQVQKLSHEAENLLDRARKKQVLLSGSAIDVTFDAVDALKKLVANVSEALATGCCLAVDPSVGSLIRRIQDVIAGRVAEVEQEPTCNSGAKLGDILLGSGKVSREALDEALQKQQVPAEKPKLGDILVRDVITSSRKVEKALQIQQEHPEKGRIGEILVQIGAASEGDVENALAKQDDMPERPKLGEVLVREGEAKAKDVAQALREQKALASRQGFVQIREAIKVDADRLDRLIDMIGELVIAESMVSQSEELRENLSTEFARHLAQLDKITRELQEIGMSLRMVPIRPTFQKMARLVRDLAKKSNKRVDFEMFGEDTELDKTVVDLIGDPLVHMIRNSVDHGIEPEEDRVRVGKTPSGRVRLKAFHKGGTIHIDVEDDGRGLDRDAILTKAIERGLVQKNEIPSDRDIYNFVFHPGFSTAKTVTDVSGRGVGMDVVKRNIETLRGQIDIQTEPGRGSVFSIRLPLTLAIIDGMVVQIGRERYILPTLSIVTSIRPISGQIQSVLGRGEMLDVQNELIPLYRLSRLFQTEGAIEDVLGAIIVVVEDEGKRAGILVDELLGQQQIVIKNLGAGIGNVPGIAGGAIMPDGCVGLILDVGGVVKIAHAGDGEVPKGGIETPEN